ncbi:MAG: hypothetical protein ABEK50_08725, partial [bacterium]
MTSSHLFVMDPIAEIIPDHDTTYVIMREVESRGRTVWWARSVDLFLTGGQLMVEAQKVRVQVNDPEESHYTVLEESVLPVSEHELVWMREDPPFDQQYLNSTYLLDHASVPVMNSPAGLRESNEKMLSLEFPEHLPPTWVGASQQRAREFIGSIGGSAVGKTL